MDTPVRSISRRSFLKLAAATGMVLSLGGCSLLGPSSKLPDASHCAAAKPAPDTEFDYIVVGSGIAGLYAASAGTHPAGGVIGCAGHNAARCVMHDLGLP